MTYQKQQQQKQILCFTFRMVSILYSTARQNTNIPKTKQNKTGLQPPNHLDKNPAQQPSELQTDDAVNKCVMISFMWRVYMRVWVGVRACVCVCMHVCVYACVCM